MGSEVIVRSIAGERYAQEVESGRRPVRRTLTSSPRRDAGARSRDEDSDRGSVTMVSVRSSFPGL